MSTICQLHANLKYYLCMQPVDMRKQFQGLQGIINQEIKRYLTQDEAFIFIGKTGTTAKILHREGNGLTLYVRKLSSGRFQIPKINKDQCTCTLEYREFVRLILGEKWEIEARQHLNLTTSFLSGVGLGETQIFNRVHRKVTSYLIMIPLIYHFELLHFRYVFVPLFFVQIPMIFRVL